MTRPAKKLDELVTITVPRSALTMVAPMPLTVTQRTCFELFGISKDDYLRMVQKGAFPVKVDGQLRIALYNDVAGYLSSGSTTHHRAKPVAVAPARRKIDPDAALAEAGFRPPRRS